MHLPFKSVCNKEHKGVISNITSSSNSFQSNSPQVILSKAIILQDECFGKNNSSLLDFTCNYRRTSGILSPALGGWLWCASTLPYYLGPSRPTPFINQYLYTVKTAPLESSMCPNEWSLLSLKIRSRFSSSQVLARMSIDLTLATSSDLILQTCLIMALAAIEGLVDRHV